MASVSLVVSGGGWWQAHKPLREVDKETEKSASSGKLVNLGNSDRNGMNVNNWKPNNQNTNMGVSLSRHVDNVAKRHF